MPLPVPNLDDRDFNMLLDEARRRILQSSPAWTDLTPGDPGIVLLELFAYLTETTIYRLNRIPEKAYIEFLNLIGVRLQPPSAAVVSLRFSRLKVGSQPVDIPRGTRVTVNRPASSGASSMGSASPRAVQPVFITASQAVIAPGATAVDVSAYACEQVEAEMAGHGSGLPGLSIKAARAPIIAPTGDELDLLVGVEAAPGELGERTRVIKLGDKTYRIWREVDNFSNVDPNDAFVYVVDRITGTITFAPAVSMLIPTEIKAEPTDPAADSALSPAATALAAIPTAGREIRLWYWRGGGSEGNVGANLLTVLKDPIPGVQVTNPGPATGGRAAEPLENAMMRGPQQIHSLQRAVTARDFEMLALSSSPAVARSKALAQASLWAHAQPGTVEVLLVPSLTDEEMLPGNLTAEVLHTHDTEEARSHIQGVIEARRPLGIVCRVNWARYKEVQVNARIVVRREEDPNAVLERVSKRLYQTISPVPSPASATGWPFGQPLRSSDVYNILLSEPGVRWVDEVSMRVNEVPQQGVTSLARDAFQPHTWYAGSGPILFRSMNDGDSWEPAGRFPDRQIELVRSHPRRAGFVAVLTQKPGDSGSQIIISRDCGETWVDAEFPLAFHVSDLAWTIRGDQPLLLLATDVGLFELLVSPGSSPVQVVVDPGSMGLGFYAITAAVDALGGVSVAAAAQTSAGIYLSSQGGLTRTFRRIDRNEVKGQDIRRLAVQTDGPRMYLWAGSAAGGGDDPGKGCFRWELRGAEDPPEGWITLNKGWIGGSVRSLTFLGSLVLAASHHSGVMRLDSSQVTNSWLASDVNCGLPLRDTGRFHPVDTVAADAALKLVMAGGLQGVHLSTDLGGHYHSCSEQEFPEKVTLPDTWLFVSGQHTLKVQGEDEA